MTPKKGSRTQYSYQARNPARFSLREGCRASAAVCSVSDTRLDQHRQRLARAQAEARNRLDHRAGRKAKLGTLRQDGGAQDPAQLTIWSMNCGTNIRGPYRQRTC